jgi:hypothetical protein
MYFPSYRFCINQSISRQKQQKCGHKHFEALRNNVVFKEIDAIEVFVESL